VSLPDVARLDRLSDDDLRALRDRLRAVGFDAEAVDRLMAPARGTGSALRGALLEWHLRNAPGGAAIVARAFVLVDPVPEPDLARALGAPLVDRLLEGGLLERRGDGVCAPYLLDVIGETLVFSDPVVRGGGAVLGSGPNTNLLMAAAYPPARVADVLDLGCGSGALSLVLAANAERVLGLDSSPRAIALARFNARLNGLRNVEFEVSDRFAAARDRTFDLIVSQPPFLALPEGVEPIAHLHGGARGDELAFEMLHETPTHLATGGRAVFAVDWPEIEGEPSLVSRLRARIDPDVDLLVLLPPPATPEEHCANHAAAVALDASPRWAALVRAWRAHLHQLGVRAVRPSLTVLQRRPSAAGAAFTASIEIGPLGWVQPSSARIGRLLAARALLAGSDDELLLTSLRIPPKTSIVAERDAADPGAVPRFHARFSPRAMLPPLGLNDESVTLAQLVHQTGSIGEALAFYQRTLSVDGPAARAKLLPHAREALERGLLEPAPSG
jgi:SAM-dependent methyltransferase